jgi:hypothetical protein
MRRQTCTIQYYVPVGTALCYIATFFRESSTVTANPRPSSLIQALADLRQAFDSQPDLVNQKRAALSRLLRPQPSRGGAQAATRTPSPQLSYWRPAAPARPVTAWQLPDEHDQDGGKQRAAAIQPLGQAAASSLASRPTTEARLARLDAYTRNFAGRFGGDGGVASQALTSSTPPTVFLGTVALDLF